MKKLLSGITAMVLVIGLFTTGVQAKETTIKKGMTYEQVVQMVEQTNKEIYEEIDKADNKADRLVLKYEDANDAQLNEKLDKIVEELLKVTSKETAKLIEDVGKSGYTVENVWIEVEVGGRFILVDPCISVGV